MFIGTYWQCWPNLIKLVEEGGAEAKEEPIQRKQFNKWLIIKLKWQQKALALADDSALQEPFLFIYWNQSASKLKSPAKQVSITPRDSSDPLGPGA